MRTVYEFSVKDRKGKEVALKEYANEVLLIVNTATKCGFTPQYEELEKLYEKYHSQGFEILDFPCNQFGQQAPGTDESIHSFCKLNFGTEFPRFKKIKVNGDDADPLFKFLKEQKGFAGWDESHPIYPILEKMLSEADPNYKESADIKWNFTKFLVNKKGQVVARFEPTENIANIAAQIEDLLKLRRICMFAADIFFFAVTLSKYYQLSRGGFVYFRHSISVTYKYYRNFLLTFPKK